MSGPRQASVTTGSPGREHPATEALRHASVDELQSDLAADLRRRQAPFDDRDLLLHLTPYWDAARRLGTEPAVVFDAAAAGAPDAVAKVARRFGRRTDLTLAVMGWHLVETPDGVAYRFAWPKWTPPKVAGREPSPTPEPSAAQPSAAQPSATQPSATQPSATPEREGA